MTTAESSGPGRPPLLLFACVPLPLLLLLLLRQPLLPLSLQLQGLLPQVEPPTLLSPLGFQAPLEGRPDAVRWGLLLMDNPGQVNQKAEDPNLVILLACVDFSTLSASQQSITTCNQQGAT